MTGVGVVRRHTGPSTDVPERQSGSQAFDPLLLNELLDKQGFDGVSRVTAAASITAVTSASS